MRKQYYKYLYMDFLYLNVCFLSKFSLKDYDKKERILRISLIYVHVSK